MISSNATTPAETSVLILSKPTLFVFPAMLAPPVYALHDLKNGWNTLTGEYKNHFENLIKTFDENCSNNKTENNCGPILLDWLRGKIIYEPYNSANSVVMSDYELLLKFTFLLTINSYQLAQAVWQDNERIHALFRNYKHERNQINFLKKLLLTPNSFCYEFISIYKSKESFFNYLNLINDQTLIYQLLEKLVDSHGAHPICSDLYEWLHQRGVIIEDKILKKILRTAISNEKPIPLSTAIVFLFRQAHEDMAEQPLLAQSSIPSSKPLPLRLFYPGFQLEPSVSRPASSSSKKHTYKM